MQNLCMYLLFEGIDFAPDLYLQYVDDILCVFKDEASKQAFFEHLNRQHDNLKFTVEDCTNRLPFLDVDVRLKADGIETTVYRKSTHTGVILNFCAL